MSFPTTKKIKLPGYINTLEFTAWEQLIENFPDAAILVHSHTKSIYYANSTLARLSSYSQKEVIKLEIASLLPELDNLFLGELTNRQPTLISSTIRKKNQTTERVQIKIVSLDPKGEWLLITLFSQKPSANRNPPQESTDKFWAIFQAFYQASQSNNLDSALEIVLSAASEMIKSEAVCIYQANSQELKLNKLVGYGTCQVCPDSLAPQELALLKQPTSWVSGKRASSALHRVAQEAGWTNLITLPIGEENATIGLFVIGSREIHSPGADVLQLQTLADFTASLIQKHSQLITLEETLEAIKEENTLYHAIENCIEEGLLVLSPNLRIITMNKAAEDILGYNCQETCGQLIGKIIISDQDITDIFSIHTNERNEGEVADYRLYRRSGQGFPAGIKILPILSKDEISRWIFIFWDKSEAEKIQMQIKRLEQQAFLGQFQTGFAHEVRNPINNISTGLQLMALNLPPDDPNQDSIARLKQDCDRLTDLMNTILSYTWTNENRMEQIDLGQLILRVIDRFKPKLSQAKINCCTQIDDALPLIWGNRRALEQVFINLVDNAIRVMKEKGDTLAIRLALVSQQDNLNYIEASIADNGPGIPKEELDRLFLPYFTTSQNGTGLGLAISKKIINGHRGAIHAESFPGGTIFYVRVPTSNAITTQ